MAANAILAFENAIGPDHERKPIERSNAGYTKTENMGRQKLTRIRRTSLPGLCLPKTLPGNPIFSG